MQQAAFINRLQANIGNGNWIVGPEMNCAFGIANKCNVLFFSQIIPIWWKFLQLWEIQTGVFGEFLRFFIEFLLSMLNKILQDILLLLWFREFWDAKNYFGDTQTGYRDRNQQKRTYGNIGLHRKTKITFLRSKKTKDGALVIWIAIPKYFGRKLLLNQTSFSFTFTIHSNINYAQTFN